MTHIVAQYLRWLLNSRVLVKSLRNVRNFEEWLKKRKNFRKLEGVLGKPSSKVGRCLLEMTKENVFEFYENDIINRIMSHKEETVYCIYKGRKEKVQNRLLLCDTKCLHK